MSVQQTMSVQQNMDMGRSFDNKPNETPNGKLDTLHSDEEEPISKDQPTSPVVATKDVSMA